MNILHYQQFLIKFSLLVSIIASQPVLFYSAFTSNQFTTNEGWEIKNIQKSSAYSDCGNVRLLGGYDVFAKLASVRQMFQLPPHNKVQVKLQFWKIDTWDTEYFYIYLDQNLVYQKSFEPNSGGTSYCGFIDYGEVVVQIDILILHGSQTIDIFFTSNLNDAAGESWGIRDFQLFVYKCPPGCLTCEDHDQTQQCIPWNQLNSAFLQLTQSQFSCDGWIIDASNQQTSLCGNIPIFGGYQITGMNSIIQTTINLPIHQILKILIRIAFIDQWNNEYLYIDIDNERILSQQYSSKSGLGIQNVCGDSKYADSMHNFKFYLPHSKNQISIKISTNLHQANSVESYGIRDFQLYYYNQFCGNGIAEANEQCDDGNLEPFDGCFMCQYSCSNNCINCLYGECFQYYVSQQLIQHEKSCIGLKNDGIITIQNDLNQYKLCKNSQLFCSLNCQICYFGICQICDNSFILIDNKCEPISYDFNSRIDQKDIYQCFHSTISPQSDYFYNSFSNYHNILKQQGIEKQIDYLQIQQQKQLTFYYISQSNEWKEIKNTLKSFSSLFEDPLTENCNQYCLICSYNICLKCNDESQLINNSCFKCGDGILDNINEQCDDLNNNDKDGCSSNCQIEKGYYCQQNELQQLEYCYRCLDQNCLYCYEVNNYFTQYCKQCEKGYFIDGNGICIKCNQICLECSNNQKNCLLYNYDYYQIKECNKALGLYYNFQLKDCESKCGDGIIIGQEQCDDSNTYDYDGCNFKCQIEKGFLLDKQTNLIIKEPSQEKVEVVQLSGEINLKLLSNIEIIEYQEITLSIDLFDSSDFKFNLTQNELNCEIQVQYLKNIEPKNQIHIFIKYQAKYQKMRMLNEYDQEIIIIPQRLIIPNEEQKEQGKKMAKAYQSVQSSVKYCIAFSLLFGGFNFIWGILDIISWINNFYFLNVNYPENVRQIFKQADWGNVISFPQLVILNQPSDSYYFQAPQKFYDKNVDPLFFNNIQFVIILIILNAITYLIAFGIKSFIQKRFVKYTNNKNKVSIFKMQTELKAQTLGDLKKQPVKITQELKIPYIVKKIYYPCYYFEQNFLAILLKTVFISYFDISTAILLQITNQQQSGHYIVAINIFFSYLAIIPLAIIIYISYSITNFNKIKLQDYRFQRKYNSFYQDLNIESNLALQYSFINLIRKTLFIISTISLYYSPIYQTSICFCACLINLIFLFSTNPFINKYLYIQNFIPDISVAVIVLISIILSFQDRFGIFQEEFIYILGWIMVVLVLISSSLQIIFLLKETIKSSIEKFKEIFTQLQKLCK